MRIKPALLPFGLLCAVLVAAPARGEYGDVVLNRYSGKVGMAPVVFPHWFHRIRFRCPVCHNGKSEGMGFIMKAGGNDVTMAEIIDGKYCGLCHNGNIAWSPENCQLCHAGKKGLPPGFYSNQPSKGPGIR